MINLKDWMITEMMSVSELSRISSISRETLYHVLRGGEITYDTYMKLNKLTKGQVSLPPLRYKYLSKMDCEK
jgi:predicted transcriptional regulator